MIQFGKLNDVVLAAIFRRLAEKKGSPRIDWEDVLCVRKQGDL